MSNTIYVKHEFFEEANHPDPEELKKRDVFLKEVPIHRDGHDIIAEIKLDLKEG